MLRRAFSLGVVCGIGLLAVSICASQLDDANRLFVLEKYEDAIGIYEKALTDARPRDGAEALFGIGRAYQLLGRWKLARERFEKLLREYRDSELAVGSWMQIGQCEIKLGNLGKALEVFERIPRAYQGQEAAIEAAYNAANLRAGFFGDDVKSAHAAIEGYRAVLDSGLGGRYAVQSYFGLGQCYMLLRDYRRAIQAFGSAVKEGPDTIWAVHAQEQISNALSALSGETLGGPKKSEELWSLAPRAFTSFLDPREPVAARYALGRPPLRIHAVGFFTESQEPRSGAEKVFYSRPTIYYKKYVFTSDRGTVDRAHRWVECIGNVKCTEEDVSPPLTVSSDSLALDLKDDRAVFSRNVRLERRAGAEPAQQLSVEELHLFLNSGKIELPPLPPGK